MAKDTGWLVERQFESQAPMWITHDPTGLAWTSNANASLRFCRRQDAAEFMEWYVRPWMREYEAKGTLLVTEHQWVDMVRTASSADEGHP